MFSKNKIYKYLFIVLVLIFIGHLIFRLYQYKDNYTSKYDPKYWEYRYNTSQWVVPNSKNGIGDDGLYAYAGWKYITGLNPILNSPEVPPFGKYMVGLTILIFKNQNIFAILSCIFALAFYFLLNKSLFKNSLLAFIPILLFSFQPLFWEQLSSTFFDLLQMGILFAIFYFILKKNYIFASIFIGLFTATRFPFMSALVVFACVAYVFLNSRKDVGKFLLSLCLWPAVYVISYLQFFLLGGSIIDFLKVIKYVFNFYTTGAKTVNNFMIFEMIFFGKWFTWWGEVLRVKEWSIFWPISFILSMLSLRLGFKKSEFQLIILWVVVFVLFLIIIPSYPRYLLLLLPFLYNLSIWVLSESLGTKFLRRYL